MAIRKNKPGCPCCKCTCPDGVTEYPKFSRIQVVISGLSASYDYYNQTPDTGVPVLINDVTGEMTGLDAINGTHIFNVEDVMTGNCVNDDAGSDPQVVAFSDFEVEFNELVIPYTTGDCSDDPPPAAFLREYVADIRLAVIKEGDHWFRVQLTWLGTPVFTYLELSGCQVFACENAFNATVDGTLTDFQKMHNQASFPDTGGESCSEGNIWLSPFGYSTNASSPFCGSTGRVFADMEVVGTITATAI